MDRSGWPAQFQSMWAKHRAVFVSAGITEPLAEIDALAANGSMMLEAKNTWWHRFAKAVERLVAATANVDPARASAVRREVDELLAYTARMEEQRRNRFRAYVGTPRGAAYQQFLLAAQTKLQDRALSAMAPFIPTTILQAVDPDLHDAAHATEPERRMRALAGVIRTTMEAHYKPILAGVWTVSALMVGRPANDPPGELGPLFRGLEKNFWPLLSAPWPTDYIDNDAKFVRNAAAHNGVRFDVTTSELVLTNHDVEQRLTEPQLRQRLGNMFERAETMRSAFLYATGQLDPGVA